MFVSLKNYYDFDGDIIYHIFQDIIWEPTNEKIDQILNKSRKDESYEIIGSVEENKLIGIIIYRSDKSNVIIEYFGVESAYRQKGIGSKLIDEVIKNTKVNCIEAETEDDAVNFYKKYGFVITSLGQKYPGRKHYRCEYRTAKDGYWERLERLIEENEIISYYSGRNIQAFDGFGTKGLPFSAISIASNARNPCLRAVEM